MKMQREKNGGTGPAGAELPEIQPVKSKTQRLNLPIPKMKWPFFRRSLNNSKDTTDPQIDIPRRVSLPAVVLTIEENLQQWNLSQAGKQLIIEEECLFGREIGKEEKESRENVEELKRNYEALLEQIRQSVESSLSADAEGLERLLSAVSCIQQEVEQDKRWREEPEALIPPWRPRQCRQAHDAWLAKLVEERMEGMEAVIGGDNMSSSIKRDICKMAIRVKQDLLKVARDLKNCYPEEFDICNVYARLYHQAFSKRLTKITEFELDVDDSTYLLSMVNYIYTNDILKDTELKEKINCNSLGDLLPVEVAGVLEEQYISDKKAQVKTWVSNALRTKEEKWLSGALPELIEGHYSSISIDVIQIVEMKVREARSVVGEPHKARPIMCQLEYFLMSYKKSLEDFMKGKRGNIKAVIKANLASLEQFQDYIVKDSDFFTEETRTSCLTLVNSVKHGGYQYLSNIIHGDMKERYRKLGTQSWLTGNSAVMEDLLERLRGHIDKCRDLKTSCFEELLGRLHKDVMVEYVKRLLKRKLKLKDKVQQEAAAKLLCENSKELHTMFIEEGSKEEWLGDILPKIAEVLKTQDPSGIQLDIITLAQHYPDLSEDHISELLQLKTNLSTSDIKMVKASLRENRNSITSDNTRTFFSGVLITKWTDNFDKIMRIPH
ncbi:hypothetical protein SKAU_G00336490 [Synaphobranchus kaupii]|uniref:Exocyst complex component 3 n=1 Tax=Synaphobranchus kaupii TaxID=118154 RepID=A0A9Q1EM71_SYNKA|nr:hypothetical protein SKAU_G00336490 [Synaphobranchus kaupii]